MAWEKDEGGEDLRQMLEYSFICNVSSLQNMLYYSKYYLTCDVLMCIDD